MQQEYNALAWGHKSILNFFDNNRLTTNDIYRSEWFFIQQKIIEGMSILDIGCAKGGMSNVLAENLNYFNYVGIDINSKMIMDAKQRYPQHEFYVVKEHDYSILANRQFDLVLCLGILHMHETWRNTIRIAWQHTKQSLILDLRESHLATMEDKNASYMIMDFDNPATPDSHYRLPYNVINASDALQTVTEICFDANKITHFGYLHTVSELAVCPIPKVMANAYCIER